MRYLNDEQLAGLMLGSILGLATTGTHADTEIVDLLRVLRSNGAITQAQYESQLRASTGTVAQQMESSASKASPRKKDKRQAEVETRGGVKVKSADGDFEFELGGELWIDAAFYQEDVAPLGNGTEVRRARVSLNESERYPDSMEIYYGLPAHRSSGPP